MSSALPNVGAVVKSSADSTRFLISDLCAELESYLEPAQIHEVYRAYLFGA